MLLLQCVIHQVGFNLLLFNTVNLGLENSTASVEELAIKVNNRVSIVNFTLIKETEELKDGLTQVENYVGVLADALNDTVERLTVSEDEVSEMENRIGELEVHGKSNH